MKIASLRNLLLAFLTDGSGATAIEYAVMTFIGVAVIVVAYTIGGELVPIFEAILPGLA